MPWLDGFKFDCNHNEDCQNIIFDYDVSRFLLKTYLFVRFKAGWGLVGNIQGGQQGSEGPQSFNHPSGFGHGNAPTPQGATSQQPGPDSSGFMAWAGTDGPGAPQGHQGPPNAGPPTQPPAGWSRDKPFMKYNM